MTQTKTLKLAQEVIQMLGAPNPLSFSKDEIIKWQECNAAIKKDLAHSAHEPIAGQCRFPNVDWSQCSVEQVRMVLDNPKDWKGYEVRYLYLNQQQNNQLDEQKQWQSLTKKERGEFVQRICNTGTMFVTPIFSIINEIEWLIWERNK